MCHWTYQPSNASTTVRLKAHTDHNTPLPTHTWTLTRGWGRERGATHLQVSVYHPHLMAVEHGFQDLLDAMTACKQQGEQVSLNNSQPPTVTSMQRQQCLKTRPPHTHWSHLLQSLNEPTHIQHISSPLNTKKIKVLRVDLLVNFRVRRCAIFSF